MCPLMLLMLFLQNNLHVTVSSLVASAVVWMPGLPSKLNPVILPLMAAIKREQVNHLAFSLIICIFSVVSLCSDYSIYSRKKYFKI
jgi:TATA-binding protein-associated factor